MILRVELFGPLAQLAGASALEVPVAEPTTCQVLRGRLTTMVPELARHMSKCRFAVNDEFAPETRQITDRDEVALIGLVCGG
jgi:molybdopterin synthase sulfur carrier subunit